MIDQEKISKSYLKGYENGSIAAVWKGRTKERNDILEMINKALASPGISNMRADVALTLLKETLDKRKWEHVYAKRAERKAKKKYANVHTRRN